MKRSFGTLLTVAALLLAGGAIAGAGHHGHGKHWGYGATDGPAQWGSLGYEACRGSGQSPIDLVQTAPGAVPELKFHYRPSGLAAVNNGHTVQVNYEPGSHLMVGDKRYDLLQFHFHSNSEHTVAGNSYPMELHLVHKSADGQLAVVGVFLSTEAGLEKKACVGTGDTVASIFGALPALPGLKLWAATTIDATRLLPTDRSYYHYQGSLTTPPCSEGVQWFVMAEPIPVSQRQLERFRTIFEGNFRPPQPRNDRFLGLR